MPTRAIVARKPDLGLSRQVHEGRRQRRWIAAASLAAIMISVALIQLGAFGDSRLDTAPTSSTTSPTATAALVTVDSALLIGLPMAKAHDLLSQAGLVVAIKPVDATGVPSGIVASVEPSGLVPPGATVTLDVSNGPPTTVTATTVAITTPEKGDGKGHKKPKG